MRFFFGFPLKFTLAVYSCPSFHNTAQVICTNNVSMCLLAKLNCHGEQYSTVEAEAVYKRFYYRIKLANRTISCEHYPESRIDCCVCLCGVALHIRVHSSIEFIVNVSIRRAFQCNCTLCKFKRCLCSVSLFDMHTAHSSNFMAQRTDRYWHHPENRTHTHTVKCYP